MKENLTFNQDPNDIMHIQTMVPLKDSNINITSCKTEKSPKDFYISSIKSELTTMKSILGKKDIINAMPLVLIAASNLNK